MNQKKIKKNQKYCNQVMKVHLFLYQKMNIYIYMYNDI